MSQENVERIRDAVVAYNRGDLDAFLDEYWTDDIDYRAVEGAPDDHGPIHGKAEMRAYMQDWFDTFDDLTVEPLEVIDAGQDQAVAVVRFGGRAKLSGVEADLTFALCTRCATARSCGSGCTTLRPKPSKPPGCASSDLIDLTPRASRERVALRIAVTDDSQTQGSGKFMSPIKAGVILAALAVLTAALIASPVAANAAPKPGVYHGVVKNTPAPGGHNEGEGYVRLKKTTNGLRIVAPGNFTCPGGPCSVQYITAPSWFGDTTYKTCNNTRNAAYATGTSIPVKAGSFDYTGRSAFDTNRKIRIAGTWATSTTITGYTRFTTTGGCVSQKLPWKMSWIAK